MCFENDLLILSAANVKSIMMIKNVFNEFGDLSQLSANPSRSLVFSSGVNRKEKEELKGYLRMEEVKLLVRYLGVPLIFKKLTAEDCGLLTDKVSARIDSWLSNHYN